MMAPGSWWVRSDSDPRWNGSGSGALVGMFQRPAEVDAHVEAKKKELKIDPPKDAEWGYMKD